MGACECAWSSELALPNECPRTQVGFPPPGPQGFDACASEQQVRAVRLVYRPMGRSGPDGGVTPPAVAHCCKY